VIEQELTELFLSLNAPEELKNIFRTTDPAVRSSIARFVSQGVYVDEESILSEYGGKLCFVVGENDDIVSSEYVREFAILHSAHFYSFAGKHHFLQHSPISFAEFLDDFLCQNHQLVFSERDGLPVTI
jgi:surfactin synthase thioesterase subunit